MSAIPNLPMLSAMLFVCVHVVMHEKGKRHARGIHHFFAGKVNGTHHQDKRGTEVQNVVFGIMTLISVGLTTDRVRSGLSSKARISREREEAELQCARFRKVRPCRSQRLPAILNWR